MQKLTLIILGSLLCSQGTFARDSNPTPNGKCPTLSLSTLPQAACSSDFKPAPLSQMRYQSQSACPSAGAIRKKFQEIFKGKKDYPGREVSSSAGQVTCTYKLDPTWQKILTTKSPELKLVAQITTASQANYLSFAKCPEITADEVDLIKERQDIIIESTRHQGLAYNYKPQPLQSAGVGSHLKEFFRMDDVHLYNLKGTMELTQPFTHQCQYEHKIGGSPTTMVIEGTQAPIR